jgi:nucleoid-associated protein YgaU
MGRPLVIVVLVAGLMATGVAVASPTDRVRVPVTVATPSTPAMTVVVVAGDHLWKISARHLETVAPDRGVGPYWREVVTVNTPSLRSGDPDLIYPGEVIEMPEISEQP